MTALCVVGTMATNAGDDFVIGDLVDLLRQYCGIAGSVVSAFDSEISNVLASLSK
jgi:hypothetical protein